MKALVFISGFAACAFLNALMPEAAAAIERATVFVHTEQVIEICSADDVGLVRLTVEDIKELVK